MSSFDVRQQRVHHQTRRIRPHKLRLRGINRPSCAVTRSSCVRARTHGPSAPHRLRTLQTGGTHHDLRDGVLRIAGECSCVACNASALQRFSVHCDGLLDWQCCHRAVPATAADRAQVACAIAVARYGMRSLARRPRTGASALRQRVVETAAVHRSLHKCREDMASARCRAVARHRRAHIGNRKRLSWRGIASAFCASHGELAAVCSSPKQPVLQRGAPQWT